MIVLQVERRHRPLVHRPYWPLGQGQAGPTFASKRGSGRPAGRRYAPARRPTPLRHHRAAGCDRPLQHRLGARNLETRTVSKTLVSHRRPGALADGSGDRIEAAYAARRARCGGDRPREKRSHNLHCLRGAGQAVHRRGFWPHGGALRSGSGIAGRRCYRHSAQAARNRLNR